MTSRPAPSIIGMNRLSSMTCIVVTLSGCCSYCPKNLKMDCKDADVNSMLVYRYSSSKSFLFGMTATFFPIFDVPVFWPILLLYFFVLFFITMKRQVKHMIKHKYIPFDLGKKVHPPTILISDYYCSVIAVRFSFSFCVLQKLLKETGPRTAPFDMTEEVLGIDG